MTHRLTYFEKLNLQRELSHLKKEERKFKLALEDEGNNQSMDEFCLRGLTKIRTRINEINSMI